MLSKLSLTHIADILIFLHYFSFTNLVRPSTFLILFESILDLLEIFKFNKEKAFEDQLPTLCKKSASVKTLVPTPARALLIFKHALCASIVRAASVNAGVWFPPSLTVGIAAHSQICLNEEIVHVQNPG